MSLETHGLISTQVKLDVSGRGARFLGCGHRDLVVSLLRLSANLSFDKDAREQMVSRSYVPTLVKLLKEHHRSVSYTHLTLPTKA